MRRCAKRGCGRDGRMYIAQQCFGLSDEDLAKNTAQLFSLFALANLVLCTDPSAPSTPKLGSACKNTQAPPK